MTPGSTIVALSLVILCVLIGYRTGKDSAEHATRPWRASGLHFAAGVLATVGAHTLPLNENQPASPIAIISLQLAGVFLFGRALGLTVAVPKVDPQWRRTMNALVDSQIRELRHQPLGRFADVRWITHEDTEWLILTEAAPGNAYGVRSRWAFRRHDLRPDVISVVPLVAHSTSDATYDDALKTAEAEFTERPIGEA